MLPDLLDKIPPDREIATVTADGAFDTRSCHNVIAARGPAAVIPPRKNAQLWKPTTAGAIARNKAVRACKYLGRALWRKLTGYHRRSRAETKMHCVKLLDQTDYQLRVLVESLDDYEGFIRGRLHRVGGIGSFDTSFAYGTVKDSMVFTMR